MDWTLLSLLLLNFVLSTAADSFSKVWATHLTWRYSLIGIVLSIFVAISWMLVVRKAGLTAGGTTMLLLSMISTVLIGLFVFEEQITKGQGVGIALGFMAVLFLLGIVRIP